MIHWNKVGLAAAAFIFAVGCANAQEWKPLVHGDTLDGWTKRGGNGTYEVKDGVITGRTGPGQKQNTFLCTNKTWSDFDLELEFKVDPNLNSGVQIRSESSPDYRNGRVHGYQVEIDPSPRMYSGAIYDEARRAVFLEDLSGNKKARDAFKQGEWNKLFISCRGNTIRTKINGVDAVTLNDDMTSRGFIALQVHATKSTTSLEVKWRNIRIQDWDKVAITKWKSDSPFGDYAGKTSGGKDVVAQVTDLGDGRYHAKFLSDFESGRTPLGEADGQMNDKGVVVFADGGSAKIKDKVFSGKTATGVSFELKYTERKSPTLGAKAPDGATVLFDGSSLDKWQTADGKPAPWKIAKNGAMEVVPGKGSIESKPHFTDADYHLEFRTSLMPYARGQHRSNSGVYIQGTYEVQVLDSYALKGADNECGGIYKTGAPRVNMAYPPLQWQTYDIHFTAARWDGNKKTKNARITVKHNGVVIQDDLELPDATGGAKYKGEPNHPSPLLLQEHHNKVQYRNIWVKPADSK